MAYFFYRAKKGPQEVVEDVLEADHVDHAVEKISTLGYVPLEVTPYSPNKSKHILTHKPKAFHLGRRVSRSQLVGLTRQLYDLIDAGIPLLKAIGIVSRQAQNPHLKKILDQVYHFVKDGGSFSEALSKHDEVFPLIYTNMIKSGEMSGNLDVILDRLAQYLEKDEETRSKIQSSLIYPGLILSVGALTIFVLLTFVIPRLADMFDDLSANLPAPTMILMAISDFLARFWWLLLLASACIGFLFKRFSVSEKGKIQVDSLKLKIPVLGEFIRQGESARFTRTLATLLSSGITIVAALESAGAILDNSILGNEAREIAKRVASGASFSDAAREKRLFPELARNMIAIGEESGRLEASLLKLAVSYERKTEAATKMLTSLLEPLLIVVIGVVVGFVVISMLLPIFQMNFVVQ